MNERSVILVPTDFTQIGDSAVNYAASLAKFLHAGLHLLHIVSSEKEQAAATATLEQQTIKLKELGTVADFSVITGNIFEDIGRIASEKNAHLIVMGTHGVSGLQHVLGSKALKVITNSEVPFIVVQNKPLKTAGYKNIVIPVDFNQEVKQSIKYAWEIGKYFNAKIHIVFVKEKDEFIAQKIERNLPLAEAMLQENGVSYEIVGLDKGKFAKEMVSYSASVDADLLTIINNHENIFTYFGGSFEQTLIANDAEIPVMVINSIHLKTAYGFSIYFG